MSNNKKPTIFDILEVIDACELTEYENIEHQFSPYMTMKWMAACRDPNRITLVNDVLNVFVFNLSSEKLLLFYLACVISDCGGGNVRYNWIKTKKRTSDIRVELISEYFDISHIEAESGLWKYDTDDYLDMAEHLGYDVSDYAKKLPK